MLPPGRARQEGGWRRAAQRRCCGLPSCGPGAALRPQPRATAWRRSTDAGDATACLRLRTPRRSPPKPPVRPRRVAEHRTPMAAGVTVRAPLAVPTRQGMTETYIAVAIETPKRLPAGGVRPRHTEVRAARPCGRGWPGRNRGLSRGVARPWSSGAPSPARPAAEVFAHEEAARFGAEAAPQSLKAHPEGVGGGDPDPRTAGAPSRASGRGASQDPGIRAARPDRADGCLRGCSRQGAARRSRVQRGGQAGRTRRLGVTLDVPP
jgi:hypothetical protein